MRWAVALGSLLLLGGCRGYKSVDFKGKIVEVRPGGIVVEVTTKPGLRVGVGTYLGKDEGKLVPDSGKVQITFPRAQWKGYDGTGVQLVGEKQNLLGREGGHADAKLPVNVKTLFERMPEDDDPWFAVVGGTGKYETGAGTVRLVEDDKIFSSWPVEGGSVELVVATPGDAELEIGGKSMEVDATGLTTVKIPTRSLILGIDTKTLGKSPRTSVSAVVKRDKDKIDGKIELTLDYHAAGMLRSELKKLEDGKGLPDKGTARDMVLVVPYNLDIVAMGTQGKVGEAKWIAIEHDKTREGGDCVYETFTLSRKFVDVELIVYEARTGKKVASKKFEAPSVACPQFASNKDSLIWRKDFAVVKEWVDKQLKTSFK